MPVDQDWTAVYPTAAPFRQGSGRCAPACPHGLPSEERGASGEGQPRAHQAFCTEWPSALDTDAKYDEHFPVKVKSKDYVFAGTSLRNPSARIVHLRVKLSSLNLDDHARKKMGTAKRHTLTITTDSCPVRRHSYDYAMYLLTVLYHESWGSV